MFRKLFWVVLSVFMMTSFSSAKEIGGVNLPDSLMAGDTKLILNGAGLRKKLFIKVYAGALYLTQKNADAGKIIEADEPMAIRMHFIYDGVSPDKLIEAWNEGFSNATGGDLSPIQKQVDRFNGFFTEEAKANDVYDIVYIPGQGTSVTVKGKLSGTMEGFEFKKAVFSIWLGDKPADSKLKKGMLGK